MALPPKQKAISVYVVIIFPFYKMSETIYHTKCKCLAFMSLPSQKFKWLPRWYIWW